MQLFALDRRQDDILPFVPRLDADGEAAQFRRRQHPARLEQIRAGRYRRSRLAQPREARRQRHGPADVRPAKPEAVGQCRGILIGDAVGECCAPLLAAPIEVGVGDFDVPHVGLGRQAAEETGIAEQQHEIVEWRDLAPRSLLGFR